MKADRKLVAGFAGAVLLAVLVVIASFWSFRQFDEAAAVHLHTSAVLNKADDLTDINLPGINGLDAIKILRADPLTAHIPIIAPSANAIPDDIEKGLAAGFYRYITKLIRIDEFMDALDTALEFSAAAAAGTPETPG